MQGIICSTLHLSNGEEMLAEPPSTGPESKEGRGSSSSGSLNENGKMGSTWYLASVWLGWI